MGGSIPNTDAISGESLERMALKILIVAKEQTTAIGNIAAGGGDLLAANNLSDVGNAATSFNNIKQGATTTATGVVELATNGESAANVVVQGNDARLSDARTPTAHATTHVTGGTDVIPNAISGGNSGLMSGADKAKLDGVEALADVTDAANVDAAGATMNTDADVSGNSWVLDEDTMASDSATKVPTQQSVKAYVDNIITYSRMALGRLSLSSGTPVSISDLTSQTTLYYVPYLGDGIALYDGSSKWNLYSISTGISLALGAITANKNNDVFIYNNAGTPTLEFSEWTNDTTRATALTYQDGTLVKSGATTRRYIGTIRTTGVAGNCQDTVTSRYVWNFYNRVDRGLSRTDPNASWAYTTSSWRSSNNSSVNRFNVVSGEAEDRLEVTFIQDLQAGASETPYIGIAKNATNTGDKEARATSPGAGNWIHLSCKVIDRLLGFAYYQATEYGTAASTFYGTSHYQLEGTWRC